MPHPPEGGRSKAFWKRWLAKWRKTHPLPPKKHKPPPPPPPPKVAPPSWTIPGPIVLTASDPDSALNPETGKPRAGINAIGRIVVPGVAPLWRVDSAAGRTGWLAQIEGQEQVQTAIDLLKDKPVSDSRAIVGTGNVPAAPLLALGVNFYFIELNAQADWEPYGNAGRMRWRAEQDGWTYVRISYGVYMPVSLGDYAKYVPLVWDNVTNGWKRADAPQGLEKDCGIFSAEGMGDTNSWPVLAVL